MINSTQGNGMNLMNLLQPAIYLIILGALVGVGVGALTRLDARNFLGRAIVGSSGSAVPGYVTWLAAENLLLALAVGLAGSYFAIAMAPMKDDGG
jgi:hypothetical protein